MAKRGFRLEGPWAEYQLGVNEVKHLPLKVEFVGSAATIIEEIECYAKQIVYGKKSRKFQDATG